MENQEMVMEKLWKTHGKIFCQVCGNSVMFFLGLLVGNSPLGIYPPYRQLYSLCVYTYTCNELTGTRPVFLAVFERVSLIVWE